MGNSHFGSISRCFNNCVKNKYKSGRITKLYNDENCIYIYISITREAEIFVVERIDLPRFLILEREFISGCPTSIRNAIYFHDDYNT